MSADDQTFLDVLSSVPNDIWKYSNEVAEYVDRHLERASNVLRDGLSSATWLPDAARPRPPPPPPRAFTRSLSPSSSTYTRIHDWVISNKVLTTVIVFAVGGMTYHIVKRSIPRKKRRAKKASNGARLEVVVVAGSPSEPLVRSISLDLERRGFIVYVLCNTIEEEVLVQNESRLDVKPLMINIVDPESTQASIERFTAHLQSPHAAFQGAKPHHLALRSLIVVPSTTYPSAPIATLSPSTLNDLLNTRLLTPMLIMQAFLPLLTSSPLSHPHLHHSNTQTGPMPSVLVLTPSIIPSLNPAFHAPESTLIGALNAFTSVLKAELSPLSIPVSHLQLGSFDISPISPQSHTRAPTISSQRAETLKWDPKTREKFGGNYIALSTRTSKNGKGSSLRELNDAVFDAMVSGSSGTINVGRGAGLYGFVGKWMPGNLVGWIMGMRKVGAPGAAEGLFGRGRKAIENVSNEGSKHGSSDRGSEGGNDIPTGLGLEDIHGLGESGYVYPQRPDGGFANQWDD